MTRRFQTRKQRGGNVVALPDATLTNLLKNAVNPMELATKIKDALLRQGEVIPTMTPFTTYMKKIYPNIPIDNIEYTPESEAMVSEILQVPHSVEDILIQNALHNPEAEVLRHVAHKEAFYPNNNYLTTYGLPALAALAASYGAYKAYPFVKDKAGKLYSSIFDYLAPTTKKTKKSNKSPRKTQKLTQ